MDESHEVRRSGRRRVRPVEFWNFVKPEDSTCEAITYNEIELTKCSIFQPFSLSYCKGSSVDYTFDAGKVKLPKKTASVARSSKKAAKKSEVITTPKNATYNSALSSRKSGCPPRERGHKRKLDYSETAEAHPLVNEEDHSPSLKFRRKKGSVSGQKSPGKSNTHSLLHESDSLQSLTVSKKKQNLDERQGDKRSPRKAADSSPKRPRQRSGQERLNKQQAAGRGEESDASNNNNRADISATPSQNHSNTRWSFFNNSDRQNTRCTQNITAFEQPSFRNVLSSTVIEVPGKAVFKAPKLPARRHMMPTMKVSNYSIDPSMVTIPEEKEVEEEKDEEQRKKPREEGHKEMGLEKEPQSEDRVGGEGDVTATASPRKRAQSEKSPAGVTAASKGSKLEKDHQKQQDTTQGAGNVRRSSRVRTKPLEFWNFEKVEVKRQEDGEVQVIHHKQDSTAHIQSRVIDYSTILGSQTAQGITLSEDLLRVEESTVTSNKPRKSPKRSPKARSSVVAHPALSPKQIKRLNVNKFLSTCSPNNPRVKSPSKHRLFSPNLNYFDEPAEEDSRKSMISVGGKKLTVVGRVKFGDLKFVVLEKKDYRCYVAQSLHNKDRTIFISYLFLERGSLVWHSTGSMTIYVISGRGTLRVLSQGETACHHLKAKESVKCPTKSKISVRKDSRYAMLKLHVCLMRGS